MKRARFRRWNAPSRCCRWDWLCRRGNARLPTPWDHHAVCGTGRGEGPSAHAMPAASPASEYLGFLTEIEKNVPETLDVHIIVDNYATHKHPRVKRWLAARPRFHVPLHSHLCLVAESSGNLVQSDYATGHSSRVVSQRQRTGRKNRSIRSGLQLQHPRPPFTWTATADSIFAKILRLCERISGTALE